VKRGATAGVGPAAPVVKRRPRWLRVLVLCVMLLLVALLAATSALSCVMSGPDPDDPRLAHVRRGSVVAPTGNVAYLAAGDPEGPRLIFVHGTPGDCGAWLDYLADPVPGWESLAIDRPGFGASDPPGAVASLQLQAAAIEPLLVERRGRWPILIGHSLGGPIVARVATDDPTRVGGLLIVAGNLAPGTTAWARCSSRCSRGRCATATASSSRCARSWRNSPRGCPA